MTSPLGTRPGSEPASVSRLPSKLFFRIGEVAGLVGVEPHVLRYWEREFRSIRPTKSAKGQRVYSRKDVENLLRVRDLLYRDGFTIAGAKKRLQRGGEEPAAMDDAEVEGGGVRDADLGHEAREFAHDAETPDAETRDQEARDLVDEALDSSEREERERAGERREASGLGPGASSLTSPMRQKLTALRDEVEAFLEELMPEPTLARADDGSVAARIPRRAAPQARGRHAGESGESGETS
jgi:DNA-binding transcriptional MerR regulator